MLFFFFFFPVGFEFGIGGGAIGGWRERMGVCGVSFRVSLSGGLVVFWIFCLSYFDEALLVAEQPHPAHPAQPDRAEMQNFLGCQDD